MIEKIKETKIKGYRKQHTFTIEKSSLAGHTFVRLLKNGNIILNCTELEFEKMRRLFL
jgi:hypothetical protein